MNGPLRGKRILNTRAPHQQKTLTDRLTAWGADVVELPFIRVERVKNLALSSFRQAFEAADVVIFTSRNAVEITVSLVNELYQTKHCRPHFEGKAIAAVGEKTGEALIESGLSPTIMPEVFEAGHLARAIAGKTDPDAHIFYPRSGKARDVIAKELTEAGWRVTDLVIYTTVMEEIRPDELAGLFEGDGIDVVTFASPSAVQSFFKQTEPASVPEHVMFAVIGSVTEKALRSFVKQERIIVPQRFTLEDMIRAIVDYDKKKG